MKRPTPGLLLALLGPSLCSCGGNASDRGSSGEVSLKTASVDSAVAGPGVTNVLALSFTAPANGFLWVSATGSCTMTQPLPVSSILGAEVATSPTAEVSNPGDGTFALGSSTDKGVT